MNPQNQRRPRAALILAGGEGSRLSALTQRIAGQPTPKQFYSVIGDSSLLEQTRRRVSIAVDEQYTFVVVNRAHERFYVAPLSDVPSSNLVVQPEARGTATAIVYALMRAAHIAPTASVAVFPSDHYVDNDAAFMRHVEVAFAAVEQRPEVSILLGITPDRPEPGYGWIEPGQRTAGCVEIFGVQRFWEKPREPIAQNLMKRGCLWNSFVLVGRVSTLLGLVIMARPDLYRAFIPLRPVLDAKLEERRANSIYRTVPAVDFCADILVKAPVNLAVLQVRGVEWSDLGEPARVMDIVSRLGIRPPPWAA